MIVSSGWAAPQLAEFLAVLTAATDDKSAIEDGLECVVHSFGAEASAIVRQGCVIASRGWAGQTEGAEILAAAKNEQTGMQFPGAGWRETVAIPVDRDTETVLLIARTSNRFTAEEVGLLRGMARLLGLTLRLLRTVAVERRHSEENTRNLEKNRALVASLQERQILLEKLAQIQRRISSREPLQHVLDAITSDARELLNDEIAVLRVIDESDPGFMLMVSSMGMTNELSAKFGRANRWQPGGSLPQAGSDLLRRRARHPGRVRGPCRPGPQRRTHC